jgi:hypothetical protein
MELIYQKAWEIREREEITYKWEFLIKDALQSIPQLTQILLLLLILLLTWKGL